MEVFGIYVASTKGKHFKPCPFCGSEEQKIYETGVGGDNEGFYYKYAICCDCGATKDGRAYVRSTADSFREFGITNAAEMAWNRRS